MPWYSILIQPFGTFFFYFIILLSAANNLLKYVRQSYKLAFNFYVEIRSYKIDFNLDFPIQKYFCTRQQQFQIQKQPLQLNIEANLNLKTQKKVRIFYTFIFSIKWQFGGKDCPGNDAERGPCEELKPCPIHCEWSQWGSWSSCSITCGNVGDGVMTRGRHIAVQANYGGRQCSGVKMELVKKFTFPFDRWVVPI